MDDFKKLNLEEEMGYSTREGNEEGLLLEKQLVHNAMKQLSSLFVNNPLRGKYKNARDSIEFRNLANKMFCSKKHDTDIHNDAWNFYTRSIAAAPNDTEELALAYGQRSALLFHLKEYDECIKDCESGLDITNSDFLKAKLLFRKVECHAALDSERTKTICREALEIFETFELNIDIKGKFIEKLDSILADKPVAPVKKKTVKKEENLPTFTSQTEAPCASTALAINYNEKWGRHIVATRKIEPGEILVIEKSYLTSVGTDGMFIFCSYCLQQTWASVPCTECIFEVYCSERCRSEAWKKFHEFECPVLSHIYNIDLETYPYISDYKANGASYLRAIATALRLLLKTINEVGGIDKMRKELIQLESCEDPRIKGFSDDGVFQSNKCRAVYSLTTFMDRIPKDNLGIYVALVCITTYHLAKVSTVFGKKFELTPVEMMSNDDIKFVGALLLKNTLLLPNNTLKFFVHRQSTILAQAYGAALHPFCSLFNHSCDPNVRSIPTKDNERIVYAKHPIEEGKQLFLCYVGDNFTTTSKVQRNHILWTAYCFECNCIACRKNWVTSMPHLKDILKNTPKLKTTLGKKLKNLEKLKVGLMSALKRSNYRYDPLMMKNVKKLMKEHAENISVHSMEYEMFEHFIYMMLVNAYGTWLNIPEQC